KIHEEPHFLALATAYNPLMELPIIVLEFVAKSDDVQCLGSAIVYTWKLHCLIAVSKNVKSMSQLDFKNAVTKSFLLQSEHVMANTFCLLAISIGFSPKFCPTISQPTIVKPTISKPTSETTTLQPTIPVP
ncbi:hypothetical protein PV327_011291, partial [Microctonus hyperodae]